MSTVALRRSPRLRQLVADKALKRLASDDSTNSFRSPKRKPSKRTKTEKKTVELDEEKTNEVEESLVKKKTTKKGKTHITVPEGVDYEDILRSKGFERIAGVDEAGRGPLAGPVVCAACIVPKHVRFDGVTDSKKVNESDRSRLFEEITKHPDVEYSIFEVCHKTIDEMNILQASLFGMAQSVSALKVAPDFILVDGPHLPKEFDTEKAQAVVKGDASVYSIACASILAKVFRDKLMLEYHEKFPQYNFAKHKGYPSPEHRALLAKLGPCDIHRRSYAPVKRALELANAEADCVDQKEPEEEKQ